MSNLVSFLTLTLVSVAVAHVTITPDTIVPEGGYFRVAFRIPHGCRSAGDEGDSYPTMKFQVDIPTSVANAGTARPEMRPFWAINITEHDDDSLSLVWTAASKDYYIDDRYFMEFGVNMKVPAGTAGDMLKFPATQYCTNNTVGAWVDPSDAAAMPAPTLTYEADTSAAISTNTIQAVNTTSPPSPTTSADFSARSGVIVLLAVVAAVALV